MEPEKGRSRVEKGSHAVISLFDRERGQGKRHVRSKKELLVRKYPFFIRKGVRKRQVKSRKRMIWGNKSLLIENGAKERQDRGKESSYGQKILF